MEFFREFLIVDEFVFRIMCVLGVEFIFKKFVLNFVFVRVLIVEFYNRGEFEVVVENGFKWVWWKE